VVCSASILTGCGAGISDGETPIIGKYNFSDSGGYGKMIVRRDSPWKMGKIVVGPTVVSYEAVGKSIIVARRPVHYVRTKEETTGVEVSPICEYWLIDTVLDTATLVSNDGRWPDVSCNSPIPLSDAMGSSFR
jgi:hypothetical protein